LIQDYLKQKGIEYRTIDGGTTAERAAAGGGGLPGGKGSLFLIMPACGGVGLNLTAADFVIPHGSVVESGRGGPCLGSGATHRSEAARDGVPAW
jgi:hypothetical protein